MSEQNEQPDTRVERQPLAEHGDLPRPATGPSAATLPDSLIAAAPDLLSVAKETLAYWEITGFAECDPDCNCIVELVRSAIAKAEGK